MRYGTGTRCVPKSDAQPLPSHGHHTFTCGAFCDTVNIKTRTLLATPSSIDTKRTTTTVTRAPSNTDILEARIYARVDENGDRISQSVMDAVIEVLDELDWREPTRPRKPYRVHSVRYSDGRGDSGTSIVEIEVPSADVQSAWLIGNGEFTVAARSTSQWSRLRSTIRKIARR